MFASAVGGLRSLVWGSDSSAQKGPTSNKAGQVRESCLKQNAVTSASKSLSGRVSASSRALTRSFAGRINSLVASCLLGILLLPETVAAAKVAETFFISCVSRLSNNTEIFDVNATPCVKEGLMLRLAELFDCTFLSSEPALWQPTYIHCGGEYDTSTLDESGMVFRNGSEAEGIMDFFEDCRFQSSLFACDAARRAANECNASWHVRPILELTLAVVGGGTIVLLATACGRNAKSIVSFTQKVGGAAWHAMSGWCAREARIESGDPESSHEATDVEMSSAEEV